MLTLQTFKHCIFALSSVLAVIDKPHLDGIFLDFTTPEHLTISRTEGHIIFAITVAHNHSLGVFEGVTPSFSAGPVLIPQDQVFELMAALAEPGIPGKDVLFFHSTYGPCVTIKRQKGIHHAHNTDSVGIFKITPTKSKLMDVFKAEPPEVYSHFNYGLIRSAISFFDQFKPERITRSIHKTNFLLSAANVKQFPEILDIQVAVAALTDA